MIHQQLTAPLHYEHEVAEGEHGRRVLHGGAMQQPVALCTKAAPGTFRVIAQAPSDI